MQVQNILDEKKSSFKPKGKTKIMKHVYQQYSDTEIKRLFQMYDGDVNFKTELKLKVGDTIIGKVAGETLTDYLFDIGYKDFLRVEKRNAETNALLRYVDENNTISQDSEIEILITELKDSPYTLKGSLVSLHKNHTYTDMLENSDEPILAYIQESLPAGFTLQLNYDGYKIPAFMPNVLAGVNKLTIEQSNKLVGQTIEIMIESFSADKGTFIASRKKYLKSLIPNEISNLEIINDKGEPTLYRGTITGTAKFGIFVEFSNIGSNINILTGMIHKDNLSDEYKNTYQTLQAGSSIDFYIEEIIGEKLILTQVWKESSWNKIEMGNEYMADVIDEKSFGLLVRLDDQETKALIPSSLIEKMNKKPAIGDRLKVKVISIDKNKRKIYLSPITSK